MAIFYQSDQIIIMIKSFPERNVIIDVFDYCPELFMYSKVALYDCALTFFPLIFSI